MTEHRGGWLLELHDQSIFMGERAWYVFSLRCRADYVEFLRKLRRFGAKQGWEGE